MRKYTLLDNPIVSFITFFFVVLSSIFLPVHFVSVLLIGIAYTIFAKSLEEENYIQLGFMVLSFSFVELSQGLQLFSLTLLCFFIYLIIAPLLKNALAAEKLVALIIVLIFYIGTLTVYNFSETISFDLVVVLIINYFIDIAILGLLL